MSLPSQLALGNSYLVAASSHGIVSVWEKVTWKNAISWRKAILNQSYLNRYKWSEEGDFEPKSLDRMQMVRRRKFSAENLFCRRAGAFFAETRLKWVLAFRSVLIRTFSIYIYIFIIFLSKVSSSGAFFVTGSYQGGVIWEWEVISWSLIIHCHSLHHLYWEWDVLWGAGLESKLKPWSIFTHRTKTHTSYLSFFYTGKIFGE